MRDATWTVVGAGEVGRVFVRCAGAANVKVLRRGDEVADSAPHGPIVVAVREGDLAPLVEPLRPFASRAVFVQNGHVDEVLAPLGGEVTRGLLWFTAKGEFFRALCPSVFHGPMAKTVADALEAGGVPAREESDREAFAREAVFKLAWNNVVGLPLAAHGVELAVYLATKGDEATAVVDETARVMGAHHRVAVDAGEAVAKLLATTTELGWMKGGAKALEFRNGAVARIGRALGIATPVNDRLLAMVGAG